MLDAPAYFMGGLLAVYLVIYLVIVLACFVIHLIDLRKKNLTCGKFTCILLGSISFPVGIMLYFLIMELIKN
jgi:hypothetical protein